MAQLDIPTIRAGVIAHAIRLGKCPEPGMIVDFAFHFSDIAEEDLEAGRIETATPAGAEQQRAHFMVTAEDIEAAKLLINTQQARYREPKMTTVKLT